MTSINIQGSALGNSLQALLMCDEIVPGSSPSYQICKTIYAYHPLGAKMVDTPIRMAMSQQREIAVPDGPEERVRDAFQKAWKEIAADKVVFNVMRLSRIYGISSVTLMSDGVPASQPIDYKTLPDIPVTFNVLDPLNTAGSLVLNQDPNSPTFQKSQAISVNGIPYHRARSCTVQNEDPLYIEYTPSGFGFTGRSVYQRALFPLKSFVQSMVTDDMVTRKAGLLIAFMKAAGSIIDRVMAGVAGIKRSLLQEAQTNNVLSMDIDEKVESLDMQNIDKASVTARKNILENIASAGDMPAKILNAETFAEGFGEGTEDAKQVAQFVDNIRLRMQPLYDFMDPICMHRAWSKEFYLTIKRDFPDQYSDMSFEEAFYRWKNSFSAIWPSLLIEPESEKIKVDDVKLKAIIALIEALAPMLDPMNRAELLKWAADNVNENEMMFQSPLILDWEELAAYDPLEARQNLEADEEAGGEKEPKARRMDSARVHHAMDQLTQAVARLPDRQKNRLDQITRRAA